MTKKTGWVHESTYNESKEWYTPRQIFSAIGLDYNLDPCSPGAEVVPWIPAEIHFTWRDNGLVRPWFGRVWVNPPYGEDTPAWMRKLSIHGDGIALVFARCDTQWFHTYGVHADAICFIKGRVQFVRAEDALFYADGICKPKGGCGAGSMLLAFGNDCAKALYNSGLGLTVPAGRHLEMFREVMGFAGGSHLPNENLPQNAESRVSLFD